MSHAESLLFISAASQAQATWKQVSVTDIKVLKRNKQERNEDYLRRGAS